MNKEIFLGIGAILFIILAGCERQTANAKDLRATPEGTLQSIVKAMEAGDLNKTLEHFSPYAREREFLQTLYESYGDKVLHDFAGYYGTAKVSRKSEDRAIFKGIAQYNATYSSEFTITMAKNEQGIWEILEEQ